MSSPHSLQVTKARGVPTMEEDDGTNTMLDSEVQPEVEITGRHIRFPWAGASDRDMVLPYQVALDHGLLYLAGYYLARGDVTTRGGEKGITFGQGDDVQRDVSSLVRARFGARPRVERCGDEIVVRSENMATMLSCAFGTGDGKHVPEAVMLLPAAEQRWLLRGMLLGCGGSDLGSLPTMPSISALLAGQLKILLARQSVAP